MIKYLFYCFLGASFLGNIICEEKYFDWTYFKINYSKPLFTENKPVLEVEKTDKKIKSVILSIGEKKVKIPTKLTKNITNPLPAGFGLYYQDETIASGVYDDKGIYEGKYSVKKIDPKMFLILGFSGEDMNWTCSADLLKHLTLIHLDPERGYTIKKTIKAKSAKKVPDILKEPNLDLYQLGRNEVGRRDSITLKFDMGKLGKKTFEFKANSEGYPYISNIYIQDNKKVTVPKEALAGLDSFRIALEVLGTHNLPLVGYDENKPNEYFIHLNAIQYSVCLGVVDFFSFADEKKAIKLFFDKEGNYLRRIVPKKLLIKANESLNTEQ